MRYLLDVNVLIALGHTGHTLHAKAVNWYLSVIATARGFHTCSITELGFVRVSVVTGLQSDIQGGKRALDAGASTGGFTDVLLKRGVRDVVAVDVGYGQMAWELRQDPRVIILDRTNVRHLTLDQVGEAAEIVVADLSFISLTLVLPALVSVSTPAADFLVMVKPQFEVGR